MRQLRDLFETAIELDPLARDAWLAQWMERDEAVGAALRRLIDQDVRLAGARTRRPFGAMLVDDERLCAGMTVGAYTLEEEIGRGGMGQVFRATRRDASSQPPVAIKLMRRDRVNPALLRRFSTERHILGALDHPGIARLIDAGTTDDGTPFVVMELVRGSAILDWCDRRGLGLWRRLELFRKVLAAVAHAHANLVVHRDIKSGNVLVTDGGEPRLLDFGIAKPLGRIDGADRTATADQFVSLFTAAPEQLEGGPVTVGCDVYALGMLLYQLLCGRPPFEFGTMTPGEIDRAIRQMPPPSMASRIGEVDATIVRSRGLARARDLRAGLRGDIEHIVQRCLRKSPDERYATVEQLDHDIDHAMLGLPIRERQSDGWYRWRRFVARHRVSAALFAAVIVAVVAAAGLGVRAHARLVAERDRAEHTANLFTQAFAATNPLELTEPGVSAREVLDAAREPLEAMYRTHPDTYANIAGRLAQAELAAGSYARASELAQRAVSAASQARLGAGDVAPLLTLDARARIALGDYAAADVLLDWAERQGGAQAPGWKLAKGRLLFRRERCDEAIATLRGALDDNAADGETTLALRRELADVLRAAQRPGEAVVLLDQLVASLEAQLGPGHPQLVLSRLQRFEALRDAAAPPPAVLTQARDVAGESGRGLGAAGATAIKARLALADGPPTPMPRCRDDAGGP
ncbi:protein kinase domain-containing protein [Tahibacter soli]|uniref:Serine/threonine-protein kinase n=1 Tax=Tahibacter soli TaxID=2983605 RepID=A0A9X4BGW9_9GAMM|nr:serine/threonine-protein kinase [Tahibacter soli]MDC8011623.1 serine/threonine-protein kinase [Tahibacter soli]